MTEQLANYPRPMPSHQEPLAVRTLIRGERITERDDIHTFTLAREVIERAQLGFSIYTLYWDKRWSGSASFAVTDVPRRTSVVTA